MASQVRWCGRAFQFGRRLFVGQFITASYPPYSSPWSWEHPLNPDGLAWNDFFEANKSRISQRLLRHIANLTLPKRKLKSIYCTNDCKTKKTKTMIYGRTWTLMTMWKLPMTW